MDLKLEGISGICKIKSIIYACLNILYAVLHIELLTASLAYSGGGGAID